MDEDKLSGLPDDQVEWAEVEKHWDERKEDDFVNQFHRGLKGLQVGMDNGLTLINRYLYGTHRGRYILIGADSGVGKSQLSDFMYIYSLWRYCKNNGIHLHIKYFSFELSATAKKTKWVCQWIKTLYGEDLDENYIMGRIPGRLPTEDHVRMVKRAYMAVEEVMKDIDMFDGLLHPTGMLQRVLEYYETRGTIHRDKAKDKKGKGFIRGYTASNPQDVTLIFADHIALINPEHGASDTKSAMDRWSLYSVMLRNIFQTIIINIQQFSTNMLDAYRKQKNSEAAIAPQRLDFGDSTYTYRDADLVLGLVKPVQFDLKAYHGYNLKDLGQCFLVVHIMKNRYGRDNRAIPLFMNPISGMFYDMPLDPHDPAITYYTNEAKRIEELCQQYNFPREETQ